jgi:hypothetical protein
VSSFQLRRHGQLGGPQLKTVIDKVLAQRAAVFNS